MQSSLTLGLYSVSGLPMSAIPEPLHDHLLVPGASVWVWDPAVRNKRGVLTRRLNGQSITDWPKNPGWRLVNVAHTLIQTAYRGDRSIGLGLFGTRTFKAGDVVAIYGGPVVSRTYPDPKLKHYEEKGWLRRTSYYDHNNRWGMNDKWSSVNDASAMNMRHMVQDGSTLQGLSQTPSAPDTKE